MPIDFSNYFKELRKRREPTKTFWNRKPPMPDFESEENQGWLQEVLGRLRGRFEEKKATLGRVGEYAGALGKAALPQEYGTRSDLLDILGRVQKVPVPEGTELPANIFTALKDLEAWEARRAAKGIARYREAGGIGEAPIFSYKGSETWEQRLKKSRFLAERAKEFEETTFAPKGTTGEYVERLAQGVLDIGQLVPGAGIIPGLARAGKAGKVAKGVEEALTAFKVGDKITDGLINAEVIAKGSLKMGKTDIHGFKVKILTGKEAGKESFIGANEAKLITPEVPAVPPVAEGAKAVPVTPEAVAPVKPIVEAPKPLAGAEVPPIPPEKPPAAMGAPEIPPEAPKPAIKAGKLNMVDLQPTDELVDIAFSPNNWRKIANRPVVKRIMALLNPSSIANDPTTKGIVLRAALRDEGQQKAKGVMAYLTELGTQRQTFGELDDAGRIAQGNLKGLNVNDIRSNPSKYADKLTDAQKAWISRADDIERGKLDFLKRNGIEVNELSFEEGGQYAGRRVLAKLDKDGNIIAEGRVGAGPGRPGAKLSVEKTRYFETAEEAIKDGYRYLPDDEALYLNVQGAYNRIADKKMADWVMTKIPWRTTAAPEEILIAREVSKIKRDEARRMVGALNRAVRGERIPGATINAISSAFPEQAQKLQDLIPSLQKGEAVADKVQTLTQESRQLLQKANMDFLKADNAAIKAREQARRLKFGEAMVRAPAFQGKILTGPEAQEAARVLNKGFEPEFIAALNSINKANAIGRYFALAGDASVFGIQLSMAAVNYPKAFAQAVGGFTRALFDTRFQSRYLAAGKDVIDRHPVLLLASNGATEYTEAFAKYGMLGAKKFRPAGEVLAKSIALAPGRAIGKAGRTLLEPFQRAFETALDTAGIEMARGLEPLAKNAGELAQIDQFVNEFRGITSSAKLGVSATQRQLETVAFLAPRYNRAIAALLFDSIRGNLRGQLARQALLRTTAGVTALGVAIGLARGETWAEILDHFNPESSNFVTWEIAGQKVGPGTKMRSVLKLAGNISRKVREGKADDFLSISPANPLSQFVRGNLAPVISTGIDLLSGRNYIGDPTRDGLLNFSKTVLAENLVPIWLQSTLMEGGDATQRILRGTTEFFGGRAYPDPYLGFESEIRKYNKIPTDPLEIKSKKLTSRRDTRLKDPDLDAKLFVTGQTTSVLTPEAARKVMEIIQEKKIDPETIPGVKRNKELLARQEELGLPNVRVTQTEALTTGLTGGAYAPPGGTARRITGLTPTARRITRTTMPSPLAGRRARRLAVRKTRRTTMPSPLRR